MVLGARLAKTVGFGIQHGVQRLFHRATDHFSQVLLNFPSSIWITWLNFGASPWLVGSIAPPLGPSLAPLFYQPNPLLFKCAKNSVRYHRTSLRLLTAMMIY